MATYIIRAGECGPVKIGKADDVEDRLASLQTAHHETLHIIRVIDTPFDAEPIMHEKFKSFRLRGEWFSFDAEMLSFVPARPPVEPPIGEIVRNAKRAAVEEVRGLIEEIWKAYRGMMGKGKFTSRLAAALFLKESRVKRLVYGEANRIDVHEIEGLRALARKLRSETRIDRPLPLFDRFDRDGEGR